MPSIVYLPLPLSDSLRGRVSVLRCDRFRGAIYMDVFLSFLLWLHFMGLAFSLGGGIALSQTGPQLVTAPENQRPLAWKLERSFSLIATVGVGVLLVSGPLLVWFKYGGFAVMPHWFWMKMALVAVAVIAVAGHEISGRRFHAGNASAYRWMAISGRTAGITMVLVVLCAVLAFD
jgi:putative membrane protein